MFIFCFTLCCLVSLAFGTLLNVGIKNVPDQIVINANQLTPLTYHLLKILENLMGIVPKRHSSINFRIIPAVDIPLVEMVYSGRLNVQKILGEIAENFEKNADLAQIFEHFLMFADGYYQPVQTGNAEKKKAEFLLYCIYSFVNKITQKCLQFFDNDPLEATKLWADISKSFISQVTPVPHSKLRAVFSQFCIGQSDGFKPVLGEWTTNWATNNFNQNLDQKIHIKFSTEVMTLNYIKSDENKAVKIILITRHRRGFTFRKKKKFFNLVIDGTEIVNTDGGIFLTKIDKLWPQRTFKKKRIFCGALNVSAAKIQEILDQLAASTEYAYNSIKSPDGNNAFTKMLMHKLASVAGDHQLNISQIQWFSGKKLVPNFARCKI